MAPDRPVPPSAARLLEETGEEGRGWLEAAAQARRLTLELRTQLGLGERLLWACRTGDTLVLYVADRATASSARFAAGAFARRGEGGRPARCVIRLGPPCPAVNPDGGRAPSGGGPPEALRRLLERLAANPAAEEPRKESPNRRDGGVRLRR